MALSKAESDIILNRANVALARSQRLVASWLPASTTDDSANGKSEEELQREEDEIFTAVPETLGVGAPLPEKAADGSWNRTELSSNDKLRKQLLGRNYDKFMKAAAAAKKQAPNTPATAGPGINGSSTQSNGNMHTPPQTQEDDYDDDEEGRVSMVGKKNSKMMKNGNNKKRKAAATGAASAGVEMSPAADEAGLKSAADRREDADGLPNASADANAHVDADDGPVETSPPVKQAPSKGRKKATSYLDELLAERSKKRKKR
ncbi:Uncharacterized protein PECH_006323 [Penicillium ucsense]|uniref:Uncharacterized protein n=1 Tax=Penicillium ucsense TaxID=2839758 RepID=A0A8J8WAD8_9EURO|nr:Uncharacterized protein PECM_001454 [Penicillium ucsense]KAF7739117.1 Uncharacterized protein PECH_006323 [Penicillium ucsense]